jgi:hypothetical protein
VLSNHKSNATIRESRRQSDFPTGQDQVITQKPDESIATHNRDNTTKSRQKNGGRNDDMSKTKITNIHVSKIEKH